MPDPTEEEQLTPEEQQYLVDAMNKAAGAPTPEEKHSVHTFLHKVSISDDTTKTGNLTSEELGITQFSERSYKQLELDAKSLCNNDIWSDYFHKKAEILTSTSLSKDGFLTNLAVIQRRQIEDITKPKVIQKNSGWFKKKDKTAPPAGEGQ